MRNKASIQIQEQEIDTSENVNLLLSDLRKLRKSLGITQKSVGDFLNVSQNAYCKMENGDCKITLEHLLKICEFFKKDPREILKQKDRTRLIKKH